MRRVTFETKALNDAAIQYAAEELKVNKEFIQLNILEEKKSMLGLNKSYIVEAIIDFDVIKDGIEYLKNLLENMQIESVIEAKQLDDRQILFSVEAKENPILIGKNGKTLEAVQILLKNYINLYVDNSYVILVDIGGYKQQRKKQLEILATKTAMEVVKTKTPTRLGRMNAYERRVIHTKLSDWRDVTTESEGEEPNRFVVIKPTKK